MVILSASGFPSGLLWCGTLPFTIKSYWFCRSSFGECPAPWLLFHSALLSKTIRSLSLCREAGRGRLGYYDHML